MPAVREHLTPKYYVDQVISYWLDELSLLRLDLNEKLNPDGQDSVILNSASTSPKTIIETPTKSLVDSLNESSRSRRSLLSVFKDQRNEFDNNKLNNLDSITVNRNPNSDNEVSDKINLDDSIGERTIVGFIQTLEIYLKVSVGSDTNSLTKYEKKQIIDTTIIENPTTGRYLIQK